MAGRKPDMKLSAKAKQGDAKVPLVAIWARDDGRGFSCKLDRGVRIFVTDEQTGEDHEIDPQDYWINFNDFRDAPPRAASNSTTSTGSRPRPPQQAFGRPPPRDEPPPGDDDIPF